jgi:multidrug efflux pump subunit AcrA (membrane-fusion protein)
MRWLLLAALCACRGGAGRERTTAVAERPVAVARGEVADRVILTGDLHAAESIEFSVPRTPTWELAIRWMAEDGAMVKAGDRVLEFDNSAFTANLEQQHITAIEAALALQTFKDVSAMETQDKQFELRGAQIALDKATVLAGVPADLLPARTAQDRKLELARAEVAKAKAEKELKAQQEEVQLAARVKQIDLEKAKRDIAAAEHTIGELSLKAPRDGVVVIDDHPWEGRKFEIGDSVQPGFTIISLPDFSKPMQVFADLNDVDDGRLNVGMTGTCTLDAYPTDPMPCTVVDLTPVARSKSRKSLRRVFAARLELAKSDPGRMRPGMSVKVELHRQPLANVLVVPRGAVVMTEKKTAQVRLVGGALRDVTLGPCDAQRCAVDKGVAEGEQVQP